MSSGDTIDFVWSRKDFYYLALLAALSGLYFWRVLGGSQAYYQDDFASVTIPYLHFFHEHFKAGLLPRWCQHILLGHPIYDEGCSSIFYPPLRILLSFFDALPAMALDYALHVFWCAMGSYAFIRHKGLEPGPSFVGAVAAAFGGGMAYSTNNWIIVTSVAWLPWIMLGQSMCQSDFWRPRLEGAAILGCSLGLAMLGGHMGITLYGLLVLLVLHGIWAVKAGTGKKLMSAWMAFGLAAAIVLLFCGGQMAALTRYAAQSIRSAPFNYAAASAVSLSPASLLHLLLPFAWGDLNDSSFLGSSWRFGTWEHQGMLAYLGLLSLALASMAVWRRPKELLPFLAAWLLLLFYALGSWTPLHKLFYHLPVFNHLRAPMKALSLSGVVLAFPVAWGCQDLLDDRGRILRLLKLFGWAGLGLALAALFLRIFQNLILAKGRIYVETRVLHDLVHQFPKEYYLEKIGRWLARLGTNLRDQAFLLITSAFSVWILVSRKNWLAWLPLLLGLLLYADLFHNGSNYTPLVDRSYYDEIPKPVSQILGRETGLKEPYRVFSWGWLDLNRRSFPSGRMAGDLVSEKKLLQIMTGDAALMHGLESFNGYVGVGLSRVDGLLPGIIDSSPVPGMDAQTAALLKRRRALDLGGVKYIVTTRDLKASGLRLLFSEPLNLYLNEHALPMACFADSVGLASSAESATEAALQSSAKAPAILETAFPGRLAGKGSLTFKKRGEEEWILESQSAQGGFALLSRAYYTKTWHASVDGQSVELLPANGAFCGVWVSPGRHTIRIYYEDPDYARAQAAHLAGWALAGLLMGFSVFLKKRDSNNSNSALF